MVHLLRTINDGSKFKNWPKVFLRTGFDFEFVTLLFLSKFSQVESQPELNVYSTIAQRLFNQILTFIQPKLNVYSPVQHRRPSTGFDLSCDTSFSNLFSKQHLFPNVWKYLNVQNKVNGLI